MRGVVERSPTSLAELCRYDGRCRRDCSCQSLLQSADAARCWPELRRCSKCNCLLPMLTQIGYALGLFLFVPLGDVVDRRQLVLALVFGIIVSLLALVLAPSLVWLDIGRLPLGMIS